MSILTSTLTSQKVGGLVAGCVMVGTSQNWPECCLTVGLAAQVSGVALRENRGKTMSPCFDLFIASLHPVVNHTRQINL